MFGYSPSIVASVGLAEAQATDAQIPALAPGSCLVPPSGQVCDDHPKPKTNGALDTPNGERQLFQSTVVYTTSEFTCDLSQGESTLQDPSTDIERRGNLVSVITDRPTNRSSPAQDTEYYCNFEWCGCHRRFTTLNALAQHRCRTKKLKEAHHRCVKCGKHHQQNQPPGTLHILSGDQDTTCAFVPLRTLPASRSGLPRVDTRYLDDDDLCLRLEAHERDHRIGKEPGTTDADVQSGYWDYSIVTGIGGSPSRDLLSLLRNASMMKEFSKITDVTRNQEQSMPPRTDAEPTVAPSSSARATHIRNTSTLTAPRSSSDKSLTCSSNYPDDTDISENSHNKYSEKRRGRHARRRRPVSMASLAAPLGEEPVEGVHQAGGLEAEAEALRDDVTEVADECQPSHQVCARGDVLGSITPAESSFAQSLPEVTTDTEASTLFTRFPPQSSPPSAAQSEHFKSFGIGLRFPVPPQSQKHSSLLSEILAVTRDSYQARKESQEQATSASLEEKSAEPAPRSVAASQSGRNQRTSFVGTRNGDPSVQVIHEHEVAAANLPLTSESLRELNRRLEEESAPRGGFATARAGSSRDLNLQINGTQAGMPSMVDAGVAATRQNLEQPRSPESQDNLSLATTTTIRPSFQVSQARSTRTAGRDPTSLQVTRVYPPSWQAEGVRAGLGGTPNNSRTASQPSSP
ncbi:hypothetical protein QFC20_001052 [Naganishia adeliensis]|uniref:Uncharacterized protein n=1 Tax=Naganishia adeliensis TaxID=92952 RepID=A0ACC2WVK4_9TREE|nr:hypothetical protein QFC20_001052 [Naganishia adeliensis]